MVKLSPLTTVHRKSLIATGNQFRYPKCCIRFFVGRWWRKSHSQKAAYVRKLAHVGFIPCPKCKPATMAAYRALRAELKWVMKG